MVATRNPYIQSAYEQLQIISQDKQKRLEYEAREKAIRDYNQLMYEAKTQGLQEGIQQGIQQGELFQLASLVKKGILSLEIALQEIAEDKKAQFLELFS